MIRFQFGIGFTDGEQAFERLSEGVFRLVPFRDGFGAHGHGSGFADLLERTAFMRGVAFDGFDQIGDKVIAPFQLNVDVGPGLVGTIVGRDQAVVGGDRPNGQGDGESEKDPANEHTIA